MQSNICYLFLKHLWLTELLDLFEINQDLYSIKPGKSLLLDTLNALAILNHTRATPVDIFYCACGEWNTCFSKHYSEPRDQRYTSNKLV